MSFEKNTYLSWYVPKVRAHDGAINLHSSGVPPLSPEELDLRFGDPWTAAARFEEALAEWQAVAPEELLFTPGATGGTQLALLAFGGLDSHVVVECPIYEPMRRQAERLGQTERMIRRPESSWRLPLDDVEKLIGADTRVVMITEPHNPSGCYAPSQDVLELADLAKHRRAVVLINEVYRGFSDRPSYHGMADNIVVVSSLSKLLGAYWARLGWLSGPVKIIKKLSRAHANLGMPSTPSAEVGVALMPRAEQLRQRAIAAARAGQATVEAWVERTPGLSWVSPQGPGFGCLKLPEGIDEVDLVDDLYRNHATLCIPGTYFDAPGTLRLSWLQAGDRLEEGLERVSQALAQRMS